MFVERIVLAAAVAGVLAFTPTGPTPGAEQDKPNESKEPCCFTNPAYSGVCKVEPAEGETCETILAYLNNPMGQGKSYCDGTKVRQGWKQVECEEESAQEGSSLE